MVKTSEQCMMVSASGNFMLRNSVLSASVSALALLMSSGAVAQEAAPAVVASEDIVVTGFRASLANAIAEKKNSDLTVESISAVDIGKLPDTSIAESLSRLPGLATQREGGRAQNLSVRGLAPDFSTILLNGRAEFRDANKLNPDSDTFGYRFF